MEAALMTTSKHRSPEELGHPSQTLWGRPLGIRGRVSIVELLEIVGLLLESSRIQGNGVTTSKSKNIWKCTKKDLHRRYMSPPLKSKNSDHMDEKK